MATVGLYGEKDFDKRDDLKPEWKHYEKDQPGIYINA